MHGNFVQFEGHGFQVVDGRGREGHCLVYGVPLPLVTMEASTFSNMETAQELFWVDTALPLLNDLLGCLSTFLLPDGETVLAYNAVSIPALEAKRGRLYYRMSKAIDGLVTIDEARVEMGYEELGGKAAVLMVHGTLRGIGEEEKDASKDAVEALAKALKAMARRRGSNQGGCRRSMSDAALLASWDVTGSGIQPGSGRCAAADGEEAEQSPELTSSRGRKCTGQEGAAKLARDEGVIMLKRWVPVEDERTRSNHAAMAGTAPIPLESDFLVGSERMARPGDPRGSASNVIGCWCVCAFEVSE